MRARRGKPEADIQRVIVQTLRTVLPPDAIVHHSANEIRGGTDAQRAQAINVGMGVHPGFADLLVLSEGRLLFLEVKSKTGRLSETQEAFRDAVQAQGLAWALVRSVDDALGALAEHGFRTRISGAR